MQLLSEHAARLLEVEGADHDRLGVHLVQEPAVDLVVLLFAGQLRAGDPEYSLFGDLYCANGLLVGSKIHFVKCPAVDRDWAVWVDIDGTFCRTLF